MLNALALSLCFFSDLWPFVCVWLLDVSVAVHVEGSLTLMFLVFQASDEYFGLYGSGSADMCGSSSA